MLYLKYLDTYETEWNFLKTLLLFQKLFPTSAPVFFNKAKLLEIITD